MPAPTNIVATTFWVGEISDPNAADGSRMLFTYDDQNDPVGHRRRAAVIPWATIAAYAQLVTNENASIMNDRWVEILKGNRVC